MHILHRALVPSVPQVKTPERSTRGCMGWVDEEVWILLGRPVGGALGKALWNSVCQAVESEPRNPTGFGLSIPVCFSALCGWARVHHNPSKQGKSKRCAPRGGGAARGSDPHVPGNPARPPRTAGLSAHPTRRQVDSVAMKEKALIVPIANCHTPDLLFCVPRIEMQTSRVCRQQSAGPCCPHPTAICQGQGGGGQDGTGVGWAVVQPLQPRP